MIFFDLALTSHPSESDASCGAEPPSLIAAAARPPKTASNPRFPSPPLLPRTPPPPSRPSNESVQLHSGGRAPARGPRARSRGLDDGVPCGRTGRGGGGGPQLAGGSSRMTTAGGGRSDGGGGVCG
jgi:hypothetical protein